MEVNDIIKCAVFGAIATTTTLFVTIVIKLNSTITTLNNQIEDLQGCISKLKDDNKSVHERMWKNINKRNK